jgi:predicted nucleotidyltransferase
MRQQAVTIPREELADFCRRRGIRKLALFGSIVRDDFGPHSDIDVLVEFEPGVRTGLRFFTIQEELSTLLGRRVDLNTAAFLSRHFRDQASAEAEVLYDTT